MEAAEAKDRAKKEAEQKAKEEAQRKLDEERAAQLGKPDADVAAPDEPAGDHVTTTQPPNAGGTSDHAAHTSGMKRFYGKQHWACRQVCMHIWCLSSRGKDNACPDLTCRDCCKRDAA